MGDAEGKVMLECESSRRREMVIERPADHLDLLRDSQRASRWKFRLWTHHLAKSIQRQREFKYRRDPQIVLQGGLIFFIRVIPVASPFSAYQPVTNSDSQPDSFSSRPLPSPILVSRTSKEDAQAIVKDSCLVHLRRRPLSTTSTRMNPRSRSTTPRPVLMLQTNGGQPVARRVHRSRSIFRRFNGPEM